MGPQNGTYSTQKFQPEVALTNKSLAEPEVSHVPTADTTFGSKLRTGLDRIVFELIRVKFFLLYDPFQ